MPATATTATAAPSQTPAAASVAIALVALYVIWGSTYLAIRFALEGGWPPFLLGGLRFLAAGGLMFAVLRWRGVPAPSAAQWRNLAVMGGLLLVMGNGLVNVGEQTVSSGMTAVIVSSSALWMAVFAALRGHRPNAIEWVGLAVGFLGVLWLSTGGSLSGTPGGLAALLAASLAWSFGSIWSKGRDLPAPFMAAAGQMLCGGAMMTVLGLVLGERLHGLPSAHAIGAFWYLVVMGSLAGFSAYIWLLHHVRPALATSYAYVNPAIAVLLGAWLAHERFGSREMVAMAIILAGVLAITLARLPRGRRA